MKIKYLKNNEINLIRWDNCINNAINGNIFAYSWYLNILCEDWEALVLGDYEYVMPILHKITYKRSIIFSSKLGNRLGIFSNKLLTEEIVDTFIKNLPKKYSRIHILLNKFNKLTGKAATTQKTYEIDLIQSHMKISTKYSSQFQKNLQTAYSKRISAVNGIMPNELINFSEKKNVISNPKLTKPDFIKLRMIIAHSLRYNLGEVYGVYTENNTLCAAAFFLKSKRKIHLMFNCIDKNEIKTYALHYLIDKFIETHTEKNLTLNIENVILNDDLDFFTGVGAHEYRYKRFFVNHLPWYYKFLIKTE